VLAKTALDRQRVGRLESAALKDVRFSNSANDRLVHLADTCAGKRA
jgi:hypothetical protein